MTTLAENPGAKLNYGIRGGIPSARMEQIHLGLAYPMKLQQILPFLVDPLVTLMKPSKMKATIRLSDGWHVLNQARIGLVEAEACKVYYEEIEPNRTEGIFWSRYYFDDAALRLHSSCEHLLRSVDHYWTLRTSDKGLPVDGSAPSSRSRDCLLVRVLKGAESSKNKVVSGDVARPLRRLRASREWTECMRHRNDWVHNRLPATEGLNPAINFKAGKSGGVQMSIGVGPDISELRETVRLAFKALFDVYDELARLIAKDSGTPSTA